MPDLLKRLHVIQCFFMETQAVEDWWEGVALRELLVEKEVFSDLLIFQLCKLFLMH